MPRPKLAPGKKKVDAVRLRLNAPERAAFDRLVRALGDEMPGVDMTDAGALRAVVVAAMAQRGIESTGRALA
jgi:hypothetical protein